MIEAASQILETADHAAKQPPLWWLGVLIIIGLVMLGIAGRFLLRRIERLETAAKAADKRAQETARRQEEFLISQLAEKKEELAERKIELGKVVEALTNSNRIIEQNSRVLEECSVSLTILAQTQHNQGNPARALPLTLPPG